MILTCPNCSTRYLLDPIKLGRDGRQVRCGKCAHLWHQAPPPDMPRQVEPIPISLESRPLQPGSNLPVVTPQAKRRGNAAGWVALVLVVAAVIVGALVARERIMQAWPPAIRLYSAIGLAANMPGQGLELRNVSSKRTVENGVQILVVEGQIANVSKEEKAIPLLRGALRDAQQREVQQWTFTAKETKLRPGEVASFSTNFRNPASEATGISIGFAAEKKS